MIGHRESRRSSLSAVSDSPPPERPSWADHRLSVCGFWPRAESAPDAVSNLTQVHGCTVHVLTGRSSPLEGDGLWTDVPGLAVSVRVADCTPILLWDPIAGAVAAVHAGWRGTARDIAGEAVRVGVEQLGVEPGRLRAAIGPCIGQQAFEVGDEVVAGLRGAGLDEGDIGLITGPRGRAHVSLRQANRALLRRAGVPDAQIEDVGGCSHSSPRYESYRRDGKASGRMRAIIALALLLVGCSAPLDPAATVDAAQAALRSGDAPAAELALRELLEQDPEDTLGRAVLARALHDQGRFREASVQGRIALGLDPGLWQVAWNLACHHARLGEADEAIHWLQAALTAGEADREDVQNDPDLATLLTDHRVAFFLNGGVLSRTEDDAVLLVQPRTVPVGETTTLTLVSLALNRALLSKRHPLELRPLRPVPPGALLGHTRRETFSTGADGDREYSQRTVHFGFLPRKPGVAALGPFKVREGERHHRTNTAVLEVTSGSDPGAGLAPEALGGGFFRAPSEVDAALVAAHEQRGGPIVELDPRSEELLDAPWHPGPGYEARVFRFRATDLEALPPSIPERAEGVFRSVLVQRGSEGFSHVLELR